MAVGWAKDGAEQDQIAGTLEDEIARARANLPKGSGLIYCEECADEIPPARRKALPGVRLCVFCQAGRDKEQSPASSYNRRGSKDSQLR